MVNRVGNDSAGLPRKVRDGLMALDIVSIESLTTCGFFTTYELYFIFMLSDNIYYMLTSVCIIFTYVHYITYVYY